MKEYLAILYTTVSSPEDAEKLAHLALSNQMAACVNIVSGGKSFYLWEGKIEKDNECYILFKTLPEKIDILEKLLIDHHPYDLPAILKWSCQSSVEYQEYVKASVS